MQVVLFQLKWNIITINYADTSRITCFDEYEWMNDQATIVGHFRISIIRHSKINSSYEMPTHHILRYLQMSVAAISIQRYLTV